MLKFRKGRNFDGHKGLVGLLSSAEYGSKTKAVVSGYGIVQMPEICKVQRPFEGFRICAVYSQQHFARKCTAKDLILMTSESFYKTIKSNITWSWREAVMKLLV